MTNALINPMPIALSFSLVLLVLAVISNNKSSFVRFSHGKLYHYLNLYILLLDEKHMVMDYNQPAFDWFSSQGIPLDAVSLYDITEALLQKGNGKPVVEHDCGFDYHINGSDFSVILNMRIHDLPDGKGNIIGAIAVFTDVTQNRLLIDRLEKKAGIDSLTGLANHMAYAGAKKRFDALEYLPLSIIMCDANGLKRVNDKFGHRYGDVLLQVVAKVLEDACPKRSFVARIGGDEFIFLLPYTGPTAAYGLIEQIKEDMSAIDNLPFSVSVAMGTATKFSMVEDIDDIIALADRRMYEDKKRAKLKRRG